MSELDNKIDDFCKQLAKVWKKYVPYWRFGEFVNNVLGTLQLEGKDIFEMSNQKMMEWITEYFEKRYPPY